MKSSKWAFGLGLSLFLSCILFAHGGLHPRVFNVMHYGAVADGKTDNSKVKRNEICSVMHGECHGHNRSGGAHKKVGPIKLTCLWHFTCTAVLQIFSQALMDAWKDACEWRGASMVLIPWGEFMVKPVTFSGPCLGGSIRFHIKDVLKAPASPAVFSNDAWIRFQYVDDLIIEGGGILDGQGAYAWEYHDCKRPHCTPLPTNLRLDFVTNSRIHHIKSINSKNVHINLFACTNVDLSHVRISAPENSPNTDGIHIGESNTINISKTIIATGDDCISMVSGTKNINISDVSCGPGHGISIGSLGRWPRDYVSGISVWNASFYGTQNGVRIKTWAPSLDGIVSDVTFGNIYMENVNNPIFIDQDYCPIPPCRPKGHSDSLVKIRGVTFDNIWGTSSSQVAVSLQCSKLVPCSGIKLVDINLVHKGSTGPAIESCYNVRGESYGNQVPRGCI